MAVSHSDALTWGPEEAYRPIGKHGPWFEPQPPENRS